MSWNAIWDDQQSNQYDCVTSVLPECRSLPDASDLRAKGRFEKDYVASSWLLSSADYLLSSMTPLEKPSSHEAASGRPCHDPCGEMVSSSALHDDLLQIDRRKQLA